MNHADHINLLRPASLSPGGLWADFGAGSGAFTLALRELTGPEAQIYAVDKDRGSLRELERQYRSRFGDAANLRVVPADFSHALDLPMLDGALMANSLHFFKDADERETSSQLPPPAPPPPPNVGQKFNQSLLRHRHLGEEGRRLPVSDKLRLLRHVRSYLKPGGTLLLVEYNVDAGNMWVPYPLSFETWQGLAARAGFTAPRLLATHPSRFLREFYSAVCYKKEL